MPAVAPSGHDALRAGAQTRAPWFGGRWFFTRPHYRRPVTRRLATMVDGKLETSRLSAVDPLSHAPNSAVEGEAKEQAHG